MRVFSPQSFIRTRAFIALAMVAVCAVASAFLRPADAQTPDLNPNLPTLFVVGDSTARNSANGAQGWGDPFKAYFDTSKINVVNRAIAGRSSRTYFNEGRWDNVLKEMKAGDIVLLQMGHNDGGPIDTGKARASLPGLGDETREITLPDGKKETVRTYGWYMRRFIADTKAKGATPIVLSLTIRNIWKGGQIERGSGNYRQLTQELAQSQGVQWIDLSSIVADRYQQLGEEKVKGMFGPDYVHTSPMGADFNAAAVVAGLKSLPNSPLTAFLSEKGKAVAPLSSAVVPVTAVVPTSDAPAPAPAPTSGTRRPLPVPADPQLPTLFLIGDSTVRNGLGDGSNGQWGWGDPIAAFFDGDKINVVNRAVGGLSSRTYFTGFWNETLAMIKPGDFVIMQFGHNDGGEINDPRRARATLRGSGEETVEIVNALTKRKETVHTYGWYLRRFVADVKAKGATPIIASLIPRRGFTDGKANRSGGNYVKWAAEVAQSEKVPFIPLNEIIASQYDVLGPEKVGPFFVADNLHTTLAGAQFNAASVVAGLKGLKPNPLAPYFSATASGVAGFEGA